MGTAVLNDIVSKESGRVVNVDDIQTTDVSDLRIAILGDSLSAENVLHTRSWPAKFEQYLNQSGIPARVFNYSINGITFNRVLSETNHGALTSIEALVQSKPDVVYVALGFNDTVNRAEGRTTTQVNSDASAVFNLLRTNLPDAKLVWVNMITHNQDEAALASLTNRDIIPFLYNFRSSGPLASKFSQEVLGDAIGAGYQEGWNIWGTVSSSIPNLPAVDETIDLDYWKIARLGCTGWDRLHPTDMGTLMMTSYVVEQSVTSTVLSEFFGNIGDKLYPEWNSTDEIFNKALTWDGTDYQINSTGIGNYEHIRRLTTDRTRSNPQNWFYSTRASVTVDREFSANGVFSLTVQGANPGKDVQPSDALGNVNDAITVTNEQGDAVSASLGSLSPGTSTVYYMIGNEHYGPLEFTVPDDYTVYPEAETTLPLQNGWAAHGTYSNGAIRVYRSMTGHVTVGGAVDSSSATNPWIGVVPVGFRPGWPVGGVVAINGGIMGIIVLPNGNIEAPAGWDSDYSVLFLDSIQYKAGG